MAWGDKKARSLYVSVALFAASLSGVGCTETAATAAGDASIDVGAAAGTDAGGEAGPQPTDAQRRWMDLGFGMMISFSINTFYDLEWSDGTLDPAKYAPEELDTDEWCRAAKEAGIKFIVPITKHIDGFCNWPTGYTDYSVKATPFGGDLIGRLVESAHKYGLAVGLYYALWDRHEKTYEDDAAYAEFVKNQLTELLTNYGEIVELWFDGFWMKQSDHFVGSDDDTLRAWNETGAERWRMNEIYALVKKLQPNCIVLNNSSTYHTRMPLLPVDARTSEKDVAVKEDQKVYEYGGQQVYLPLELENTTSREGKDQFADGSWFWHEWDHSVATKQQILDWLDAARQLDAVLLLNVGPMAKGKLRPEDYALLTTLQ